MRVSTLMERPVQRIDEDAPVQQAAEIMGKKRIGSLLVTRENENIGVITEEDIISKLIAEKYDLDAIIVKEVMSQPPITVDKDTEGETVIKLMDEKKVHRVFVTDKDEIIGIFSTSDITKLAKTNQ